MRSPHRHRPRRSCRPSQGPALPKVGMSRYLAPQTATGAFPSAGCDASYTLGTTGTRTTATRGILHPLRPRSARGASGDWIACRASTLRPRPAEPFLGKPRLPGENSPPANGRLQHTSTPGKCVDGRGCLIALEEEDHLALADEHMVSLEPDILEVDRRFLLDKTASERGCAPPDGNDHGHTRSRHVLGA
jgi:hypothetical protein